MKGETPNTWYKDRLLHTESELRKANKQIRTISFLRIISFLGIIICAVVFEDKLIKYSGIGLCFILFAILLKLHGKLFPFKQRLEVKLEIFRKELKALEYDFSEFDEGSEFIDPNHYYTFDLDVFGRKSLFQILNRTCTQIGKETLAAWLQNHLRNQASILERQNCIQDLASRNGFREEFAVTGNINSTAKEDISTIKEWIQATDIFTKKMWVRALLWGIPTCNAILLATGILEIISLSWFGLFFSACIIFSFAIVKRASILQDEYTDKLKVLSTYAKLIDLMEAEHWESPKLQKLVNDLRIKNQSPSKILAKLSKEIDKLDLRNNQLLYVILEGLFFFQLHQIAKIERWKIQYGQYLENWIAVIGEMDALCSLGTFAYNHPTYVYPTISNRPFCFKASGMGHPAMSTEQCVRNDANIPSRPYFLIITGANMAGKSTYLRTIGTNYILACIGAPVCCEHLEIYPSQLITSLRTTDSLSENESYFFAELKRLKRIIDLLNQGEELFIILDEILKGTNSADKQKGSFNLIRQFILSKTNGIIATHDLLLGELASHFPDEIKNFCFEADIKENELSFSYKIREGVAQNMNACFLMKKMGIVFE